MNYQDGSSHCKWDDMKLSAGKQTLLILICISLVACASDANYAPVTDITTIESIPKTGTHQALQRETLYEVAWRYGLDYRELAARNQIKSPYAVETGRTVYLRGKKIQKTYSEIKSEPNFVVHAWIWPAKGKIINTYSAIHQGINIAGNEGEVIVAAAPGKVVYCGRGLRGYGNLIIIKHNSLYLSAYAHNKVVYVKEGNWVKQGQKIAEMGETGADRTMLHFEIRRAGLPINPIPLLESVYN